MSYWLLKSEPEEYSYADLMREGKAVWDGVRNPQAQGFLRQMRVGDLALFYYTGTVRAVVGIARVSREAFPDPTNPDYIAIEVIPVCALAQPVSLAAYKAAGFVDFALVRQPRLSVLPVPESIWAWTLRQGGLPEGFDADPSAYKPT
ncbi:MAG: EVE domain-containing protein [Bacteroidia bacterium]|nr:EVE domain-containing protein [Bacteroidia bacterium]